MSDSSWLLTNSSWWESARYTTLRACGATFGTRLKLLMLGSPFTLLRTLSRAAMISSGEGDSSER